MLKQKYRVDLSALMRMYETNYAKLLKLLPCDNAVGSTCVYHVLGNDFQLDIIESTRYTTLISIYQHGSSPCYMQTKLIVRMYHDARVAEVCSSQQISRIKPRYDYPNPRMHQCDEKQQINEFLRDWLVHCLRNGMTKQDIIF